MTTAPGFGPWVAQAAALERLSDADILTALQALPKESQILIYLADIQGLAYKEISEITGIQAEAMASWLYQIRCRLGELAVGAAGLGSAGSVYGNPRLVSLRRLAAWRRPGRLDGMLRHWLHDATARHQGERPCTECERVAAELDSALSANRDRRPEPGVPFRRLYDHRLVTRVLSR
jgi:Sigma-70, region 4